MMHHILNGDCLADQLSGTGIRGEVIVFRECLIEGPLQANDLEDFWSRRADFIAATYHGTKEEYFSKFVSEMEKLMSLPEGAEICLWFEHDLFCQANMWFVIALFAAKQSNVHLFRIFPVIQNEEDIWKGFGISDADMLRQAYSEKTRLTSGDFILGQSLWDTYSNNDVHRFESLSYTPSGAFKYLPEVCRAHLERFQDNGQLGRPEQKVNELMENKSITFQELFTAFCKTEGIYGFGDVQVRRMFDALKK